eukprot:GHVS01049455.1.p1 GENE.GHVS01049455.1~~GHVS01049455.1.p1  ORF type:complete len:518 (+),score=49.53 GHVS01049455.1:188-1741(+)
MLYSVVLSISWVRMDCSTSRPSLSLEATSASSDRIYIFHLEPSKDSALFSTLVNLSAITLRLFGADPSHCYLPHCSLSSFFVVPSSRSPPSTSSSSSCSSCGCVGSLFCSCDECVLVRNVVQAFVQAPIPWPPPLLCISPISSPGSPVLTPSTVASSPVSPLSFQGSTDQLERDFPEGKSDEEGMLFFGSRAKSSKHTRSEGSKSPSYYPPMSCPCPSTHSSGHTLKLPRPLGSVLLTTEPQSASPMLSRSSSSCFRTPEGHVLCEGQRIQEEEKTEEDCRFIYDEVCSKLFADGSSGACSWLTTPLRLAAPSKRYGYPSNPLDRSHGGGQSRAPVDFSRWDTLSLASPKTSLPPSPSASFTLTAPQTSPAACWPPSSIPLAPSRAPITKCPVLCTATGYVVISLQCEYLKVFMNNLSRSLLELPEPVAVKPKKVNHITVASEREQPGEEGVSSVQRSIEALYHQALSCSRNDICEFDVVLYECLERSRGYYQDGMHSLREVLRVHNAVSLTKADLV